MSDTDNKVSFSQQYDELKRIAQEFEKGAIDLEKAIPEFKRAAELAVQLKKRLKDMENEIEEIQLDLKDELLFEDDDLDDDDDDSSDASVN